MFSTGAMPTVGSPVYDGLTLACCSLSSLEPPNSLDIDSTHPRRIKLTAPNINLSLDQSEGSVLSDDNLDSQMRLISMDELETPDEADSLSTLAMVSCHVGLGRRGK